MAALVTKRYPFSEYVVTGGELSNEASSLLDDLMALVDRKMSCKQFSEKHSVGHGKTEAFLNSLDVTRLRQPLPDEDKRGLEEKLLELVSSSEEGRAVALRFVDELYGYEAIQPLLDDEDLEEIMLTGGHPVYVYHRKNGICRTNLRLDEKQVKRLLNQITPNASTQFDDVRLADGSRANVIVPPAVTEPSLTIRKFRRNSLTVIDLVKVKTLSAELAGFLWMAFDGLGVYPLNVLVVGGTAAGKTTLLNALTSFIPPSERIITIEDTPEINLMTRENWVQLIETKKANGQDLLRNALRMRPDRLIVGDVRGGEAETLFTAMNTGHRGSSGTLHANNSRDAISRLTNEPMNVPRSLVTLADVIVVQHRFYDRKHGLLRRVVEVSEVSKVEDDVVGLNELFKWDPVSDSLVRSNSPSGVLEKLSRGCNKSITELLKEAENRTAVLDYLVEKGVRSKEDLSEFMTEYYEQMFGY